MMTDDTGSLLAVEVKPMSADIILFVPRSNAKADRAFWIGPEQEKAREALLAKPDTAPSEYVAPSDDCA